MSQKDEFQRCECYILLDAWNVVSQRSSVHFDKTPIRMSQVDTIIIASKLKNYVMPGLMCRSVFTDTIRNFLKCVSLVGFLEN